MAALDINGARRRAAGVWSGFTSGQKTTLALAVAAVVLGGYFFTKWAAQPTWAPLYGNLGSTDAASVTQELSGKGVQYKLADGGATVLVPQAQVYQLRLNMSAKGLPTGGSQGYALLDKQGITTSEFRQRVDYQRALEGELARTIGAIDGVSSADVHLVIPADDVFADDSRKPSASVLLRPKTPGKKFSSDQVRSVVNLVAGSVEGLTPAAVTVADSAGHTLSAPGQTSPVVSGSTSQETFAGPGAATAAGGVLGTTGQNTTTNAASTANNYSKNSADRSFAVGKVTEQVKSAPGRVSRLSVAVL